MTESLEQFAERLRQAFVNDEGDAKGMLFELNQPSKLTVQKAKNFRKTAFIGGEGFIAENAYVGKRGKIICIFSPEDPTVDGSWDYMEMSLDECKEKLDGFDKFMMEFLREDIEAAEARAKKEAEEEESRVATEARRYEGTEFGSW